MVGLKLTNAYALTKEKLLEESMMKKWQWKLCERIPSEKRAIGFVRKIVKSGTIRASTEQSAKSQATKIAKKLANDEPFDTDWIYLKKSKRFIKHGFAWMGIAFATGYDMVLQKC